MFNSVVYQDRRNKLRALLKSGIVIFLGNNESPMSYPANTYRYRQDSNFLYYFGLSMPGLAGIIDIDNGKDVIFGNDVDIDDIIWMGPQPSIKELGQKVAVNETYPFAMLSDIITDATKRKRTIHFLPPYRAENKLILEKLLVIPAASLNDKASIELIKAIVAMRSIKDEYEIKHLDEIQNVGYKMHTTFMKMAREGIYEREIAGFIEGIALSNGGTVSFPVILSKHGETLHNHYHGNKLTKGNLVICDAGFESEMGYATDNTRVAAVGGKFSQQQKEIYQIVLDTNNAAIEAIKPGIEYREIHNLAATIVAEGLKNLGLMKGDTKEAVAAGAHALFFPHGLGHMMGLDVHDMENLGENFVGYDNKVKRSEQFGTAYLRLARKLQTGFVLTVEPGIYFIPALIDKWQEERINSNFINFDKVNQYRNFGGIRLEDDIIVTETGNRILGNKRIPITINEVEKTVQAK
ncbi:MAG: Xaa-Pro aminopeptidase [Bacteroidetes bacterium CG_4_10_14_3_um_filter_31_20]|nr:aminopeptidase P family protein [Bacteroidota bacterium]PIY05647.1 MAG: Xaa-Pro aminopeptidase [Bacteroidetes bacterium CG_4_10_14_3_um_filter_31_20]